MLDNVSGEYSVVPVPTGKVKDAPDKVLTNFPTPLVTTILVELNVPEIVPAEAKFKSLSPRMSLPEVNVKVPFTVVGTARVKP